MRFFFATLLIWSITSCTNKATIDNDLKQYFDKYVADGCFTIMDNVSGKVTVYNLNLDTTRFTPASTFKILNSLIALETGKAVNEDMIIKWDGITRFRPEWNQDMNMKQAFKVSSVPYYQEIARRVGMETYRHYIDTLGYGNKIIGPHVDTFWLDNSLKISPDEQVGFLKRLYFDQLPFRKSVQQSVRDMMLREENTQYKLSYKTGLNRDEQGISVGWLVGWIEENNHVYFFATLLRKPGGDASIADQRLMVTKNILKHYGFFEGKK